MNVGVESARPEHANRAMSAVAGEARVADPVHERSGSRRDLTAARKALEHWQLQIEPPRVRRTGR
jgi:hypothetical protein